MSKKKFINNILQEKQEEDIFLVGWYIMGKKVESREVAALYPNSLRGRKGSSYIRNTYPRPIFIVLNENQITLYFDWKSDKNREEMIITNDLINGIEVYMHTKKRVMFNIFLDKSSCMEVYVKKYDKDLDINEAIIALESYMTIEEKEN